MDTLERAFELHPRELGRGLAVAAILVLLVPRHATHAGAGPAPQRAGAAESLG